jgi:hypothetical protein
MRIGSRRPGRKTSSSRFASATTATSSVPSRSSTGRTAESCPSAPVHHHQLGEGLPGLQAPGQVALHRFRHGPEVVVSPFAPDPHVAIEGFPGLPVLEHHRRGHHLRPLEVGDVEADHEPGHHLQVEAVLELVQDGVRPVRGPLQLRDPILQEVSGIDGRQLHQAQLLAPLGHPEVDPPPSALRKDLLQGVPVGEVQGKEDLSRQVRVPDLPPTQVVAGGEGLQEVASSSSPIPVKRWVSRPRRVPFRIRRTTAAPNSPSRATPTTS